MNASMIGLLIAVVALAVVSIFFVFTISMVSLKNFMERHDKVIYSLADVLTVDANVFAGSIIEAGYITGRPVLYGVGTGLAAIGTYLYSRRIKGRMNFVDDVSLILQWLAGTFTSSGAVMFGLLSAGLGLRRYSATSKRESAAVKEGKLDKVDKKSIIKYTIGDVLTVDLGVVGAGILGLGLNPYIAVPVGTSLLAAGAYSYVLGSKERNLKDFAIDMANYAFLASAGVFMLGHEPLIGIGILSVALGLRRYLFTKRREEGSQYQSIRFTQYLRDLYDRIQEIFKR